MAEVIFLDKEKNWRGRKIKEAIYINALNTGETMDPTRVMNLEKGFKIDPIWAEFNPVFRNQVRERIGK